MKKNKLNTVPNGVIMVSMIGMMLILSMILSIVLLPNLEGYGMLVLAVICVLSIVYYVKTKHFNYISFSKDSIYYKKEKYDWHEVYVTMAFSKPIFARNSYDYYFYFSDHYLTEEELKNDKIKKAGFYLIVTKKRLGILLPLMTKKIVVIKEGPYGKIIYDTIVNFNDSLK